MSARTPIAYVLVAGFCLLLHNAVMILADRVGIPLWLSVLISFGLVASIGYAMHGLFTFRQPLALASFARYALAMSANIPVAFVTTWFWHVPVGLPMSLAAPIATVCMVALNFVLSRWAIVAPGLNSAARR